MNNSAKNTAIIIGILAIITGGLLTIDIQSQSGEESAGFFTNILRNWVGSGTITDDLLEKTTLKGHKITTLSSTEEFFSPYLKLPEKVYATPYQIENSSILVSEVATQNPSKVMAHLIDQPSHQYRFNNINQSTFYLNQVPASTKNHNYLAIEIDKIIYGFVYKPIDHRKILEIIDVLQKNQ